VSVYVDYRRKHADVATVKDLLKDLQDNNINVRQVVELRLDQSADRIVNRRRKLRISTWRLKYNASIKGFKYSREINIELYTVCCVRRRHYI
jgi:lipoate synthase